jgi:NADH-quinone oxidoreductase subunit E
MAVRRLAPEEIQPKDFVFTETMEAFARRQVAKYPEGRQASAVIPLLWQVQGECGGWLPRRAIEAVADRLHMPYMRVLEVATFYTMFNLEPVGKYFIQCCGTTPCALRGANDVMAVLKARIGEQRHVTPDGLFSWLEVECLGSCCNAPMAQINADYFEDLTPEIMEKLLDEFTAGREPKAGSQQGRNASEPKDAVFTLQDPGLFDGSVIGAWRKRFEATDEAVEDRAAAEAASDTTKAADAPKIGKPDAGRATERPVADAPAQRAAAGETPINPAARADAAAAGRTNAAPTDRLETVPSPASDKSYVATPSAPEKGRPVAEAPAGDDIAAREERDIAARLATLPKDSTPEQKADAVGVRPVGLAAARDSRPDDLKRVKGIGPVNEQKLNALGIYHFDQIAGWSRDEIRWVGTYLAFPGRIDRESWVSQAAELSRAKS